MNLDEWLSFLMASERTQKPFWDKVLQECFKFYKIFNEDDAETIRQLCKVEIVSDVVHHRYKNENDTSK